MPIPPPVQRVVSGRVLDADSGSPVGGVAVSLRQPTPTGHRDLSVVVTTGDGRFNVEGSILGDWWVAVEGTGYESARYFGSFEPDGVDYSNVALHVYRTIVLRPGPAVALRLFNEAWSSRCGPEGMLWCRRVVIESDGRRVDIEAFADDAILLTADPDYQEWNRDYAGQVAAESMGGPLWIVRRFSFYRDPPAHVRLIARAR